MAWARADVLPARDWAAWRKRGPSVVRRAGSDINARKRANAGASVAFASTSSSHEVGIATSWRCASVTEKPKQVQSLLCWCFGGETAGGGKNKGKKERKKKTQKTPNQSHACHRGPTTAKAAHSGEQTRRAEQARC